MRQWPEHYVNANGISIHYHRTGGAKPAVVLLHGYTDNGLCWTAVARVLESIYDVIMLDTRGHGHSDGPINGFSPEQRMEDVAAVIQELELDRPYVLGHSMGASTAAYLASRYPKLVRSILLEDPPWHNEPPQAPTREQTLAGMQWLVQLKTRPRKEIIETARQENPGWSDDELGPWADSKLEFDMKVLDYGYQDAPWREQLRLIPCPTLLIAGNPALGAIVTPEIAAEASTLLKRGEVATIEGAGHSIRRDQFGRYIAAITNFLKDT